MKHQPYPTLFPYTTLFRSAYRLAHAKATSASQAKTDSGRKAEADEATSAQRLVRDRAELARDAAYHRMIGIRGSAGERQQ